MKSSGSTIVEVTGLRKGFGDTTALDGVDLHVTAGTTFALLGPNGAGKTTTVHILSTLLAADEGVVRVAGHDAAREPDAVRRLIGVTGQFSAVDTLLTGEENLTLMADLFHLDRAEGRRRVAGLLERFDLVDAARRPAVTYSGDMLIPHCMLTSTTSAPCLRARRASATTSSGVSVSDSDHGCGSGIPLVSVA